MRILLRSILVILAAVASVIGAEDAASATLDRLFNSIVNNQDNSDKIKQAQTEIFSFIDAHLPETADYLVNKRLVGDDRSVVPFLGEMIKHYCEKAADADRETFLDRLLASPDYGKRCFFVSFFWVAPWGSR